eukprot:3668399-Pleurochrysis_carterae.AAC.4
MQQSRFATRFSEGALCPAQGGRPRSRRGSARSPTNNAVPCVFATSTYLCGLRVRTIAVMCLSQDDFSSAHTHDEHRETTLPFFLHASRTWQICQLVLARFLDFPVL